jgi:glycosyltransferase involved in cell wall biosynthesis
MGDSYDVAVGMDCLNASTALVLKLLGKVNYVVYYTVDVTDKRFSNPLLSWVYMQLDKRCCQFADEVWDVSIAVKSLRQKHGYGEFPRINKVIPIGVYPEEYKQMQTRKSKNPTVMYLGSLFSIMGIQLAIQAMPLVLRRLPKAQFVIVGKGDYEQVLRTLVRELGLEDTVTFEYYHTRKDNIRRLFSATIGVAPYTYDDASYKFYCDPTKVKEYFAAGLPVVITDVPDVSKIISKAPMGITVKYDTKEFADGVISLLTNPSLYARCRKNIDEYIKQYSWNEIFSSAFAEINRRFL